ncbi:MAG: RNA polymerase subunit sigma-24 [Bacteroidia bacterium]|nr:MAG: RNA polymerase subunit sigma-24 [Bacteroidia bacterium]
MTIKEYNTTVNDFSDSVYRFILSNIKDENESQDIVQESFEKLWVNRKKVVYKKAKSYLFTVAYRSMIDKIRKQKRMNYTDQTAILDGKYEEQYNDLQEILHEALEKLPEVQRSVILLRDYEGYPYRDIAEITGLSEAQVKVYIYRGRVALKNYIRKIENLV